MPTIPACGCRLALSVVLLSGTPERAATWIDFPAWPRGVARTPAPTARRPAPDASSRLDSLADYRLRDQFGREHRRAGDARTPTLYVIARRDGAGTLADWARALRAALGAVPDGVARGGSASEVAAVAPVVQLPGVPGVLRGAVRRLLPHDRTAWALLDWEEALAGLRAPGARCTVALVARDGRVLTRTAVGAVDEALVRELVARARAASG